MSLRYTPSTARETLQFTLQQSNMSWKKQHALLLQAFTPGVGGRIPLRPEEPARRGSVMSISAEIPQEILDHIIDYLAANETSTKSDLARTALVGRALAPSQPATSSQVTDILPSSPDAMPLGHSLLPCTIAPSSALSVTCYRYSLPPLPSLQYSRWAPPRPGPFRYATHAPYDQHLQ
ncbi:hypothetical protein NUW54_g10767 [Trametes sanguinea]|uniref:Uncharacterized protein n=1 Tax=Trametes sanguinea TaxID=158606 RepID=A0ACC1NTR3_9APHY|nr:hypothetical protein NUW54_g10767 [Trametes sanguinea]